MYSQSPGHILTSNGSVQDDQNKTPPNGIKCIGIGGLGASSCSGRKSYGGNAVQKQHVRFYNLWLSSCALKIDQPSSYLWLDARIERTAKTTEAICAIGVDKK
ncbi:unnamed protein product [Litomosoides sigmodontis]|uniref:Uncharacterized protein n=1 Tax=Litomosoides sigmodontis TaxID=42156 RepID=A0A3P6TII8_LITSI|nr:unnamed protein product [Litomosoides sigmodontis]